MFKTNSFISGNKSSVKIMLKFDKEIKRYRRQLQQIKKTKDKEVREKLAIIKHQYEKSKEKDSNLIINLR